MKLVSWNVNGIRAVLNKGLFQPFLDELQPDVVCLQEIKATEEQVSLVLPGYAQYWNSAVKKGYSGTAIFTKEDALSVLSNLPAHISQKYGMSADTFGDPNTEGRILAVELKSCFVVTVYTPNSKPGLERLQLRHSAWDPAFLEFCTELQKKKPVIFCGDLNVAHTAVDLKHPKSNEGTHGYTLEERAGVDAIISAGFVDTFRMFTSDGGCYTWWSHFANARKNNSGWRIDYFFVSASLKGSVVSAGIHADILGSDHCPVSLVINV